MAKNPKKKTVYYPGDKAGAPKRLAHPDDASEYIFAQPLSGTFSPLMKRLESAKLRRDKIFDTVSPKTLDYLSHGVIGNSYLPKEVDVVAKHFANPPKDLDEIMAGDPIYQAYLEEQATASLSEGEPSDTPFHEVVAESFKKDVYDAIDETLSEKPFHEILTDSFKAINSAFDIAKTSGFDFHEWQEPPRSIPYDPLLVKSWFSGRFVPSEEAWSGIRNYLQAHGIKENVLELMDVNLNTVKEAASLKSQRGSSECQQTALLRWETTNKKTLELKGISSGYSHQKPVSKAHLYGHMHIKSAHAASLDNIYDDLDISGTPSLSEIKYEELHRHSTQLWETGDFKCRLQAVRNFFEIERSEIAEYLELSTNMIKNWEGGVKFKDGANAYLPSLNKLNQLCSFYEESQSRLMDNPRLKSYPPFLDAHKKEELIEQLSKLRGSGRKSGWEHKDTTVFTRDLVAEIVTLRNDGHIYADICNILKLGGGKSSAFTGLKKAEKFPTPLSPQELSEAKERLSEKGYKGPKVIQLGAVRRGREAEHKLANDNRQESGRGAQQ